MEQIVDPAWYKDLTFEKVYLLFQETGYKFQETERFIKEQAAAADKRFQEAERLFQQNEKRWQEIREELGGIGKSNGEIAEDFFYSALEKSLEIGKLKFDYIDRNLRRKRNNTEAEFDIILYNSYKVVVVEIKYNFKLPYLRSFYKDKLKRFRTLFPEYSEYKLYGAIASMTFDKEVISEAQNYGFYILSQNNDNVKIINPIDFEPNEVK